MQLIGKQLGLVPRFLDTRFANLILGVNAQRFDVVASALYVTPERSRQVDFLSYLKTGSSLMVLTASDFRPQRPEDLCGKRVGSIKGASWVPKLNKVSTEYCLASGKPAIESREFPTSPEAAQALLAKAVDVQMEDPAVAKITVQKLQGKTVISSSELIYPVVIGLAVRKGNQALLGELTTALGQIKQNGSYGELLARYNLDEPNAEEINAALGTTTH
jgi:polar amino acid transport system substrate-binding protein